MPYLGAANCDSIWPAVFGAAIIFSARLQSIFSSARATSVLLVLGGVSRGFIIRAQQALFAVAAAAHYMKNLVYSLDAGLLRSNGTALVKSVCATIKQQIQSLTMILLHSALCGEPHNNNGQDEIKRTITALCHTARLKYYYY